MNDKKYCPVIIKIGEEVIGTAKIELSNFEKWLFKETENNNRNGIILSAYQKSLVDKWNHG